MRYLFFLVWTLLLGGALFAVLFGASPVTYTAGVQTPTHIQTASVSESFPPQSFNVLDEILRQIRGVSSFAAQAIGAVTGFELSQVSPEQEGNEEGVLVLDSARGLFMPSADFQNGGTLIVNIPMHINDAFSVAGRTTLASTTIAGELVVLGGADVASLVAQNTVQAPRASFNSLGVSGEASMGRITVGGAGTVRGLFSALGGIDTQGADINLGAGELFASNVVNRILAGDNVRITGSRTEPRVSLDIDFDYVESINGEDGDVELEEGDDISIDGLTIENTSTLSSVRARGGCSGCLLDEDVADALSLLGGTVNGTPIGLSSAAQAAFTDVLIGTTTATNTLTVIGNIEVTSGCVSVDGICLGGVDRLVDLSDVSASSTAYGDLLQFDGTHWVNVSTSSLGIVDRLVYLSDVSASSSAYGDILQYDGSQWVNVSTSSLGLADTFLELADTPNAYIANALVFSSSTADRLIQSSSLVFDGTNLSVGTSTSITTLTVAGSLSALGRGAVRFYDTDSSAYVGFRATSTLSGSTVWTLPDSDGAVNHILVTDGAGNLRFADVSSVGGGSDTFIGLDDTPAAYVSNAIPYASSTLGELLFDSEFVFDGTNLGIGTTLPTDELTVQGSVRFEADSITPGFVYDPLSNRVGVGTAAPAARFAVQGGSVLQRGGASGSVYTPLEIGAFDLPDNGNDIKVVGSYAYVVNSSAGNEFRIVNISNPSSMATVGSVNLPATANALAVSGRYAYVVTDVSASEFQVIDVSNPALPSSVATINLPTSAYDVFIQGRYAYVGTGGTGDDFHIIDISDPLAPRLVGSIELGSAVNGIAVSGKYAYLAMNTASDELYVVDISNPTAPLVSETLNLPASALEVFVLGSNAFVVTSGIGNDFHVVNISNPLDVSSTGSLNLTGGGNSVYVSGNYAYVASSGSSDNVAVIDISSLSTPVLVGNLNLTSGIAFAIDVVGTLAYVVTSSSGNDLHVINVYGMEAQTGFVHALGVGSFVAAGNTNLAGNVFIGGELRVGTNGIQTDGNLFTRGTSTSFFAGSLAVGTTTSSNKLSLYSGSGDSALELGVSTNKFTVGIDQSDASKFKISSSSVLGTNDRFVIDGLGRIGMGTSTPTQELVVTGTIQSTDLLGGATNLTTDTQGNIIRDPSDRRLKTDIETIDGALEKVLSLRGVSYKWIDEDRFGNQTEIGFIAQEVDTVLPEVVRKGGEYWSLNTRNILAVVIEAFKEVWEAVQGNTAKIELLEERVEELEAELYGEENIPDTNNTEEEENVEVPDGATQVEEGEQPEEFSINEENQSTSTEHESVEDESQTPEEESEASGESEEQEIEESVAPAPEEGVSAGE